MANEIKAKELVQGVGGLAKEIGELSKEIAGLRKQFTETQKVFDKSSKSQSDLTKKTKALTDLEKQRISLAKQTKKVFAQNLAFEEKKERALIKGNLLLRKRRAALKEEITGEKAAAAAKKVSAAAQRKLNKDHAEAIRINNKLNKTQKKSGGLWKTITKGVLAAGAAMAGVTVIIGKVISIVKDAIVVNRTFEKTFANVLTLLDQATKAEFKLGLEKGAIDIVANYGLAIEDVNKSLFDAISAGIPAGKAIEFLNRAAKTAIAGNAELSDVVDGATNVIGAYGDAAGSTEEILNAFFAAQVKGKTTVGLLATNIGKVASTAAAADIPLNELFGTFAGLTKFIGGTEESATSLAAIMKTIIKPSNEAGKIFKELGIETGITGLKSNGLLNTLKQVADAYEDNNDVLGDLVPNVRAFKGIAGLTAESIAEIESNILDLNDTEASSILVQEAFNEQMKTQQKQAELLKGNYERLLITIGGGESIFKRIGTVIKSELSREFRNLTINIERFKIAWDRVTRKITKEQAIEAEKQLQIRFSTDEAIIESVEKTAEELALIAKDLADRKAKLAKRADEREAANRLKANEKLNAALFKVMHTDLENELRAVDIKAEAFRKNGADEIKIAKFVVLEKARINKKFRDKELKLEEEWREKDKKAQIASYKQAKREQEARELADDIAKRKKQEDLELLWQDVLKEIKEAGIDATGKIALDRLTAGIDNDLAVFQSGQDAKQKILDDQLDKGILSEKEFADKSAKLEKQSRIESAKANKKKALFDIAIATLVGVAKVIPNVPLMALAAALGAAQAVAVSAEPIPKFKHGTDGQLKVATDAIVSEGGQELLKRPGMPDVLTPKEQSLVHLPKNSQVFPNYSPETQAALSGGMSDEHYNGLIASNNRIEKAVKSQPRDNWKLTDGGLTHAHIMNNTKLNFLNDWIKK